MTAAPAQDEARVTRLREGAGRYRLREGAGRYGGRWLAAPKLSAATSEL